MGLLWAQFPNLSSGLLQGPYDQGSHGTRKMWSLGTVVMMVVVPWGTACLSFPRSGTSGWPGLLRPGPPSASGPTGPHSWWDTWARILPSILAGKWPSALLSLSFNKVMSMLMAEWLPPTPCVFHLLFLPGTARWWISWSLGLRRSGITCFQPQRIATHNVPGAAVALCAPTTLRYPFVSTKDWWENKSWSLRRKSMW